MKFSDAIFEGYSDGELLSIAPDTDCECAGLWDDGEAKFAYFHNKEASPYDYRYGISMMQDGRVLGYAHFNLNILDGDRYGHTKFTRYIDLTEFYYLDCMYDCGLLIDRFIKYARYFGAKFIRISTKEPDFGAFYDRIGFDIDETVEGDCYIRHIEEPIEYDDLIHIREYEGDRLTISDLCFLQHIGFAIDRDYCIYGDGDDAIIADRHSGELSFPACIDEGGVTTLVDEGSYPMLFYLTEARGYEDVKRQGLRINLKIADHPYNLARLGNERLIAFGNIPIDDNYFKLLYDMKADTGLGVYSIFTAGISKLPDGIVASSCHRSIDNELPMARLCLELDRHYLYPPDTAVRAQQEFNKKLRKLSHFHLGLTDRDGAYCDIKINLSTGIMYVSSLGLDAFSLKNISRKKYIGIFERACFSTWKSYYRGECDGKCEDWTLELEFEGYDTVTFRGTGGYPRIWKYFIRELLEDVTPR